jgi:mRNA degradation ribonuclease J1/J2
MIELLRPGSFIPIHGTLHHLTRHAELASDCGVEQTRVLENGQSAVLVDGRLSLGDPVPAGVTRVAYGGALLDEHVLQRRLELGRQGLLSVAACMARDGKLVANPSVAVLGVPAMGQSDDPNGLLVRLARDLATEWRSLRRAAERGSEVRTANERPWITMMGFVSIQTGALELQIESYVQRWVDEQIQQRPLVTVHVQVLREERS